MGKMLLRLIAFVTLLVSCLASSPPAHPTAVQADANEWTQHAHDPQRTSYSPEDISGPWRYKWQWNGADENGHGISDWVPMRALVQPITGGGRVYVVAGWVGGAPDKVYALAKSDGHVIWSAAPGGELSATPAYSDGYLFVASGNGTLYKLNANSGQTVGNFSADSSLETPPLVVGDRIYFTSRNGTLYAINKDTMSKIWTYSAGAQAATMPAYSASRNIIIFCDRELYVHAVDADGKRVWRVKPTNRAPFYGDIAGNMTANQASFDYGWPVVADNQGVVFVRLRLDWNTTWSGPGYGGSYPTTNAAIRQFLENNPGQQCLFALDLDDGSRAFTPAVGNSALEENSSQLIMGPQPAVRRLSNGKEVAYIIWRNGQVSPGSDGRWDSTMGEMVLDNSTVAGYQAGDLRFVRTQFIPTDESGPVTAAGNFVFHGHWLVMCSSDLGNRTGGDSYSNAIGQIGPYVIWAQAAGHECSFNANTRWCSSLYTKNDTRNFGAGFYVLYNDDERYRTSSDPYAFSYTSYVVVSDGMIIVKSIDGAIFVLEYESGQEPEDDPDLSLSSKRARTVAPHQGEAVTYDIILRNSGGPLTATTTVTDIIPSGLNYVSGSVTATMGTPYYVSGAIRWSGVLSTTPVMTLTYRVSVTAATPTLIQNTAVIDSGPFGILTRSSAIVANGYTAYLPVILRSY
ncbi:MAG: PQQ-binding-like beta-propeller repeat protein [Anaerolineae bacterium]|jgi:uncharacterized repeat protein (TIGR01451 family)|nr:PQQ-binding-like beta-propeller repeat protein [Anaerolineae bacterium]MDH7473292.1 PQQ-binding-like beta-propeller repeat protein [Anaerolineae bacterium]